ncbi:MAG TPA: hypothetical protein VM076_04815 [Gemmatimonadaceae bacterium]|nr:hypothetical protein [Gemmatimonadaceae bacterium]
MNQEECIDPELLAAFLDGTATPQERQDVLRIIATSETAYRQFSEASAVQQALTETAADKPAASSAPLERPNVAAGSPRRRSWLRYVVPTALAAGVAIAMLGRSRGFGDTDDVVQLVQATSLTNTSGSGALGQTLGPAWNQPPWSATRGADGGADSRTSAFRSGVRYAEFELAARAADSTAVVQAAEAIDQLASAMEGAAPLAATFRSLAVAPDFGTASRRAAAARQLRELVGAGDWFDLGAWTETARLAIAARQVGFFDPRGSAVAELRELLQPHVVGSGQDATHWVPVRDALTPLLAARTWTSDDLGTLESAIDSAMVSASR